MALGFIIGYVALRRTRGMHLALVTLGFAVLLQVTATQWFSLTRGNMGLYGLPVPEIAIPYVPKMVFGSLISSYYLVLALLVSTIYLISRLMGSRFGKGLHALRENEELANAVGIAPLRHYVLAFTIATALAALAGAVYVHHIGTVHPKLLGVDFMLMMLVMVVVGGSGTLPGPVIGAAFFVGASFYLTGFAEWRWVFFGAVLLVAIVLMRQGIYPTLASLWQRLIVQRTWGYGEPE